MVVDAYYYGDGATLGEVRVRAEDGEVLDARTCRFEVKIEDQAEFVECWGEKVRGKGKRSN